MTHLRTWLHSGRFTWNLKMDQTATKSNVPLLNRAFSRLRFHVGLFTRVVSRESTISAHPLQLTPHLGVDLHGGGRLEWRVSWFPSLAPNRGSRVGGVELNETQSPQLELLEFREGATELLSATPKSETGSCPKLAWSPGFGGSSQPNHYLDPPWQEVFPGGKMCPQTSLVRCFRVPKAPDVEGAGLVVAATLGPKWAQ